MKSINLMKNVRRFTPPPIVESDLPSNRLYDLPSNRLWQFTPPKSLSPTYPQIICTIYPQIVFGDLPPPNHQVQLTLKSSVQFTLKLSLVIYPPRP